MHENHQWLSTIEAAQILRCDPRTVRALIADGRLPAARLGRRGALRIDRADLGLLKERRPAATGVHQPAKRPRRRRRRRPAQTPD